MLDHINLCELWCFNGTQINFPMSLIFQQYTHNIFFFIQIVYLRACDDYISQTTSFIIHWMKQQFKEINHRWYVTANYVKIVIPPNIQKFWNNFFFHTITNGLTFERLWKQYLTEFDGWNKKKNKLSVFLRHKWPDDVSVFGIFITRNGRCSLESIYTYAIDV